MKTPDFYAEKNCDRCKCELKPTEGQTTGSWNRTKYCEPCRKVVKAERALDYHHGKSSPQIKGIVKRCNRCFEEFVQTTENKSLCVKCNREASRIAQPDHLDYRHPMTCWLENKQHLLGVFTGIR